MNVELQSCLVDSLARRVSCQYLGQGDRPRDPPPQMPLLDSGVSVPSAPSILLFSGSTHLQQVTHTACGN